MDLEARAGYQSLSGCLGEERKTCNRAARAKGSPFCAAFCALEKLVLHHVFIQPAAPVVPPKTPQRQAGGASEAELVAFIRELLEVYVNPVLAQDGGGISFHKFDHRTGLSFFFVDLSVCLHALHSVLCASFVFTFVPQTI